MSQSVVQPVKLSTTDGRELRIILNNAAAARVREYMGLEIMLERLDLKALPRGDFERIALLSAVKWSNTRKPRPGWVWDRELWDELQSVDTKAEQDEFLLDLFEVVPFMTAWVQMLERGNKGLPLGPPPTEESPTVAIDTETTQKQSGSDSGPAPEQQELLTTNSGT